MASELPISPVSVPLSQRDLRSMLELVRTLFRLSQLPAYRQLVVPDLPAVAAHDPGHASLMMGYDFHLTPEGPRLIEVNTNAGGLFIAREAFIAHGSELTARFSERLLQSFLREWRDYAGDARSLQTLVIMDDNPSEQSMLAEMQACCNWLNEQGFSARVVAPEELQGGADGIYLGSQKIDLIYNRHCDFFLESEQLAFLRRAYLDGQVCLSPNPFAYGLLADKRRMILWSDSEALAPLGLSSDDTQRLLELVPRSRLLADLDPDEVWQERKRLVFKPTTLFGSRGVILGKSMTRKRFASMDPQTTLVQDLVAPSVEQDDQGRKFKVDLRLFIYREQLLGVTARLYQGQVTNLRSEGGGFAPVQVIE